MNTRDDVHQMRELTSVTGHANTRLHLCTFATWRFTGWLFCSSRSAATSWNHYFQWKAKAEGGTCVHHHTLQGNLLVKKLKAEERTEADRQTDRGETNKAETGRGRGCCKWLQSHQLFSSVSQCTTGRVTLWFIWSDKPGKANFKAPIAQCAAIINSLFSPLCFMDVIWLMPYIFVFSFDFTVFLFALLYCYRIRSDIF